MSCGRTDETGQGATPGMMHFVPSYRYNCADSVAWNRARCRSAIRRPARDGMARCVRRTLKIFPAQKKRENENARDSELPHYISPRIGLHMHPIAIANRSSAIAIASVAERPAATVFYSTDRSFTRSWAPSRFDAVGIRQQLSLRFASCRANDGARLQASRSRIGSSDSRKCDG
jgi:hypothetical protein